MRSMQRAIRAAGDQRSGDAKRSQRGAQRERRITRREESDDPDESTRIVEEVEQERGDDRHSR